MKIAWHCVVFATLSLALVGCVPAYKYDSVVFSSRVDATNAARQDISSIIGGVIQSDQKVSGTLLVVVPTRDVMEKHGVVSTGSPSRDQIEYIVDILELGFLARADIVRAAQIFDFVSVARSVESAPIANANQDFQLWLYSSAARQWQWYFSRRGSTERVPVAPDMGLDRLRQSDSFNKSIVDAAKKLNADHTVTADRDDARSVRSQRRRASGTAFFLNESGQAATNAHVVAQCDTIRAVRANGESIPGRIKAIDNENDLAVVQFDANRTIFSPMRIGTKARPGDQIVVYGFPYAGVLSASGNLATGVVSASVGLLGDSREIQISAPIQPGNSGGPVFDQFGAVIGIVTSKLNAIRVAKLTGDIPQNVNFAIKANVLATFLDANGIRYSAATRSNSPLSFTQIGERAAETTFLIECY